MLPAQMIFLAAERKASQTRSQPANTCFRIASRPLWSTASNAAGVSESTSKTAISRPARSNTGATISLAERLSQAMCPEKACTSGTSCVARAAVEVYAYGGPGTAYTPGVSFSIRSLQKLKDGPRLDGRKAAVDEFDAEDLPEAGFDVDGPSGTVTETAATTGNSKDDLSDLLG